MAKKKKTETWIVGGGKPPKKVSGPGEGIWDLFERGGDSKMLTVKDETKKRPAKVKKEKEDK